MNKNKRRIVFLDVDGVLNNDREFDRWRSWNLDEPLPGESKDITWCIDTKNVEQLNRIIKETHCTIVVTSTWRTLMPLQTLDRHLRKFGFTGPELLDKTIEGDYCAGGWGGWGGSRSYCPRYKEINHWLLTHEGEYDSYVILDDILEADNQQGRYVQTWESHGLTKEKADEVIKSFRAQETNSLKGK